MLNRNTRALAIALATSAMILSGCGGEAYRPVDNTAGAQTPGTTPTFPGSGSGGGGNTIPEVSFDPAMTYSFTMTGAQGTDPSFTTTDIETDSILKVRINAGPASQVSLPLGYSNFTANYSCVSYTVSALGKTVTTQPLAVDGGGSNCANAQTSQVIDFSDRLTPGHGPVQVTVNQVRYDFYCKMWEACQGMLYSGAYWDPTFQACYYSFPSTSKSMYCPLRTVYKNHTVTGDLAIQINGTVAP